jgi:hypothetical protein
MPISPADAQSALRDVDATQARVHDAIAYHHAAPHLILWGVIWVAGYVSHGLSSGTQSGWVWLALVIAGALGSFALGMRSHRVSAGRSGSRHTAVTAPIAAAVIFVFFLATFSVFRSSEPAAYLLFPALVTGLIYTVLGMVRMHRMMWIGAAIMLLSYAGYLLFAPYLAFWIAGVGGGGLIVSGLWLRSA